MEFAGHLSSRGRETITLAGMKAGLDSQCRLQPHSRGLQFFEKQVSLLLSSPMVFTIVYRAGEERRISILT